MDVKDLKENNKNEDSILEHIGSTLLESVRKSDIACRYSKHEFVIVLPNTSEESIVHILNRLSDSLKNVEFDTKVIKHLPDESCEQFIARVV
jgi:diguanylate cyclase (GGDEF)-like protein